MWVPVLGGKYDSFTRVYVFSHLLSGDDTSAAGNCGPSSFGALFTRVYA